MITLNNMIYANPQAYQVFPEMVNPANAGTLDEIYNKLDHSEPFLIAVYISHGVQVFPEQIQTTSSSTSIEIIGWVRRFNNQFYKFTKNISANTWTFTENIDY